MHDDDICRCGAGFSQPARENCENPGYYHGSEEDKDRAWEAAGAYWRGVAGL